MNLIALLPGVHRTRLACAVALAFLVGPAWADTFWVTSLNDGGAGSLREAVNRANANPGPDVVRFKLDGLIELSSPLLIKDDVRIDGSEQRVVVSGGGAVSLVVHAEPSKFLELARLTLTRAAASASMGGAVLARGNLRLTDVLFTDNLAPVGGAVYSSGALLQVINSTFADNQALSWGGAIAVSPTTQATIVHSTFVNNQAAQFGGALFQNPIYAAALQPVAHSGAGPAMGAITVRNSVLSGVSAQGNCSSISNRILDGGGNLSSDDSCPFTAAKGSINNLNPMLSALADHGGPTRSFAPLQGSPLVDTGVDGLAQEPLGATLLTDQRGQNRNAGLRVDRGAVEVQPRERSADTSALSLGSASPAALAILAAAPAAPAVTAVAIATSASTTTEAAKPARKAKAKATRKASQDKSTDKLADKLSDKSTIKLADKPSAETAANARLTLAQGRRITP